MAWNWNDHPELKEAVLTLRKPEVGAMFLPATEWEKAYESMCEWLWEKYKQSPSLVMSFHLNNCPYEHFICKCKPCIRGQDDEKKG